MTSRRAHFETRPVTGSATSEEPLHRGHGEMGDLRAVNNDLRAEKAHLEESNRVLHQANEAFSAAETRLHEENEELRSLVLCLQDENEGLRLRCLAPKVSQSATPIPIKNEDAGEDHQGALDDLPPIPDSPQPPLRSSGRRAPKRKRPSDYAASAPPSVDNERREKRSRVTWEDQVREAVGELRRSRRLEFSHRNTDHDAHEEPSGVSGAEEEAEDIATGCADEEYEPSQDEQDHEVAGSDDDYVYDERSELSGDEHGDEDEEDASRGQCSQASAPSLGMTTPAPTTARPSSQSTRKSTTARSNVRKTPRNGKKSTENSGGDEVDSDLEVLPTSAKPRYSKPRKSGPRFAIGTLKKGPVGFKFVRMPRTCREIWAAWFSGSEGNPAIEDLRVKYGVTWRNHPTEMGYASDYVSKRQLIIEGIRKWAGVYKVSEDTMVTMLDGLAEGRVATDLLDAFRHKHKPDPFEYIKPRPKKRGS